MVYSPEVTAPSVAPTISTTETAAASLVRVLVDGSVRDVLYQQGRGAGLSDDVISLILQQLNIQVTYKVLKCDKVFDDFMNKGTMMLTNCLIIRDTVMNICIPAQNDICHMPDEKKPVPQENLFISGSLKTSNIVMANWTREMWQTVLTRAVRRLTSGPLASNFFKASITITSIN